jgi:hypothetical protein
MLGWAFLQSPNPESLTAPTLPYLSTGLSEITKLLHEEGCEPDFTSLEPGYCKEQRHAHRSAVGREEGFTIREDNRG